MMSELYLRLTSLLCKLYINVSHHDPSRHVLLDEAGCIHSPVHAFVCAFIQFISTCVPSPALHQYSLGLQVSTTQHLLPKNNLFFFWFFLTFSSHLAMRFKIPSHSLSLFKIAKPHWPGVHPTPDASSGTSKALGNQKECALIQHFKNNQWYWECPWVMFRIFNHQLKLESQASRSQKQLQLLNRVQGRGLIMRITGSFKQELGTTQYRSLPAFSNRYTCASIRRISVLGDP